jgi:hypothetical protein
MEHSPCLQTDSSSAGQVCAFTEPHVSLFAILSHMNPVHNVQPYWIKIDFNIILQSMASFISHTPMRATCPDACG